jgi:cytochrome c peroxidase
MLDAVTRWCYLILLAPWGCAAALPPVPYPAENPPTEAKRVLGKILFWDEQLSSDNTVACGTCHRPAAGGGDPRSGTNPGTDAGTIDDVHGSPGIARLDRSGHSVHDPVFGFGPQVTARLAPSNFGALWAGTVFWDGRAAEEFRDPVSGAVAIRRGGALENQVLATLANAAEMAKTGRTWQELTAKLTRAAPLALATDLPADVAAALRSEPGYPALFDAAFGDAAITPVRIAFAIADYERTLVADQTPWDRYEAGDVSALNQTELYGWRAMQTFHCVSCHAPPLFTNNDFFNIGLRRVEFDRGRENVTHVPEDAGDMKVPTLRNVGLQSRFMHTGEFTSLAAALGFYRSGTVLPHRDDIPGVGIYAFNVSPLTLGDVAVFLEHGLTDPRVAAEAFPFDRPRLRTERDTSDKVPPGAPEHLTADATNPGVMLRWRPATDDTGVADYVLERGDAVVALTTATQFLADGAPEAARVTYRVRARDAAANASAPAVIEVSTRPRRAADGQ